MVPLNYVNGHSLLKIANGSTRRNYLAIHLLAVFTMFQFDYLVMRRICAQNHCEDGANTYVIYLAHVTMATIIPREIDMSKQYTCRYM